MLASHWQHIQKLLVIDLGGREVGLNSTAVLQTWRQSLPTATITLMTTASWEHQLPWVDEIMIYEDIDLNFSNPERQLSVIAKLYSHAFDAAVIFTGLGESPYPLAYICYLAGIPIRIGQSQEFGGSVLSECGKPLVTR